MENYASNAKFQSKFGTATTKRDIAERAIKLLSRIPILTLVILFIAGMLLKPFGIDISKSFPIWFIISMNVLFILMMYLKKYCKQSFDLGPIPTLYTWACVAEVLWAIGLVRHL